MKSKKRNVKETVRKVILIVSVIVFVYSIYMIGSYYYDVLRNSKINRDIEKKIIEYRENENSPVDSDSEDPSSARVIMEEFRDLLDVNQDFIGYIMIPETRIKLPLVQADDNEYYLHVDFYGSKNRTGTVFMDFRNNADGSDSNTILYGHNMKDGSMFKDLTEYKKKNFFEINNIIYFDTLYERQEWKVFSVYITEGEFNYIKTEFNSLKDFGYFAKAVGDKSMHKSDIEVGENDQILTLSTCTNVNDDQRLVVHAKRIK